MTQGAHRARSPNADKLITAERLPPHSERSHGAAPTRWKKAIYRWWVSDPSPLHNRLSHTHKRARLHAHSRWHAVCWIDKAKNMLSQGENLQRKRFFFQVFFRAPENKQINKQTDKQMAPNVEPCLIMKTERWNARTFDFFQIPTMPISVWKELLSVTPRLDSLQLNSVHVELPLALGWGEHWSWSQARKYIFFYRQLCYFYSCKAQANMALHF